MKEQEFASPTSWLWLEIARRFGQEAADDLHQAHNEQVKLYARKQTLDSYRRRLPQLRWRLDQARKAGAPTRRIEQSIALAEQRLREAGIGIPGMMGEPWLRADQMKGDDA